MLEINIKLYPTTDGGFTVAYTHPFTKRRTRKHFKTKQEAENYKLKTSELFESEISTSPEELRVSDGLISFLKEKSESDLVRSRKLFVDFSDTFGSLKIKDVTTDALRTWMNQLQMENAYRDNTMAGTRSKVNKFFRHLISKKIIKTSPLEGVHYNYRVTERKNIRTILSESALRELIQKSKEHSPGYFYPILLTFAETAAKTDEVIELKWEHVDFKKGLIEFPTGSTLDKRRISISKELIERLSEKRPVAETVFTNMNDRKFKKRQLTTALIEFKERIGDQSEWMYLDVRHSFAHHFLVRGGSIQELKCILGHRSVHTTTELYGDYRSKSIDISSPFDS